MTGVPGVDFERVNPSRSRAGFAGATELLGGGSEGAVEAPLEERSEHG